MLNPAKLLLIALIWYCKSTSLPKLLKKNKVGVDCFDQMTRLYKTRSASRRWPLSVWENILDIATINVKILFAKCTGNRISRRQFIFQLMKNLRNEPELTSTGTSTSAVAVPAAYLDRK